MDIGFISACVAQMIQESYKINNHDDVASNLVVSTLFGAIINFSTAWIT